MSSSHSPTIIAIGEFLWDRLPTGDRLGGAPANLCIHATALGARGTLISAVGTDDAGDRALEIIASRGVSTRFITRHEDLPTGIVTIEIDARSHHHFTIGSPAAWDAPEITPEALRAASTAEAIVFGTLGQRTPAARSATQALIGACGTNTLRLCDANFRAPHDDHDLLHALLTAGSIDILKINHEELHAFSPGETPHSFFARHTTLTHLVYTRGSRGALLLDRSGASDQAAPATEVADSIGAGDAYTAAFLTGLLAGKSLDEINHHALQIAAYVCAQSGATPDLAPFLQNRDCHTKPLLCIFSM